MALPHSLAPLDYPARFQWNQPGISRCLAQTACTDTCIQMIIEYYLEKTYTLSQIRAASGKGIDCKHGLTMNEALIALKHFGVTHYKSTVGVDASFILQKAYIGPVLFGVGYNEFPAKKGVDCDQTNLAQLGGKIDCSFQGPHAELALGNVAVKDNKGNVIRYDAILRDPDHWEALPPKYDRITGAQLTKTINAIKGNEGWTNTFCLYPTKKKEL